tara:strand:+ start:206 stop:796 length:591 start_codon:yes stop_codon:yes gene_type:complete
MVGRHIGLPMTKMYEISNDPATDTHILVPSGYGGLNDEELQAMEDQVRKANKLRIQENEELVRIRREEQARLKSLDDKNPAYKKQWEKNTGKKLGEPEPYTRKELENQRQPVGGKAGCSSCAKKGLMGLIKGGAKLLKAELGIDAADEATMATRKALCLDCPIYDFGVCLEEKGGCGCFVAAKVRIAGEECPKGKW